MRTTISVSDRLMDDLMRLSRTRSRSGAVTIAISEWVRRRRIEAIKKLRGTLDIEREVTDLREMEIREASAGASHRSTTSRKRTKNG